MRKSGTVPRLLALLICVSGPRILMLLFSGIQHHVDAVVLPRGGRRSGASPVPSGRLTCPPSIIEAESTPPPSSVVSSSSSSAITTTTLAASRNEEEEEEEEAVVDMISSKRNLVLTVFLSAVALVATEAWFGLIPGPLSSDGILPYADELILQDMGATALTAGLGYEFVKIVTTASDRGWVEPRDSRKIIHTCSAPFFMFFWPLFSPALGSKFFAAVVPALNAIRLYLASTGTGETSLSNAVSRSGDSKEALGGPFIYVCILSACILLFWRSSPAGIVALSTMAVGDGLADLIGRRLGANNQWPGLKKSVAGSLAFWLGSVVTSVGLLWWSKCVDCLCHFLLPGSYAHTFFGSFQQCSFGVVSSYPWDSPMLCGAWQSLLLYRPFWN